jgi:predicted MPP superfamily phosphohydrolase
VALVLTDLLGRVPPLLLTPAWLALAATSCWPWGELRPWAGALSLAFTVADGIGLALLPRRGRSYGPVTPPLLGLALVRTSLAFAMGLLWGTEAGLLLTTAINLIITAISAYATWVEPFRITVTRAELHSPKLAGQIPVRLLHISDLHVERVALRERELLRLVGVLAPDAIVITGDYINLSRVHDAGAQAEARQLLADLCALARCPVYAITGSPPVDLPDIVPDVFEGVPINWLLDTSRDVQINGQCLRLVGLSCQRERSLDVPQLRRLLADDHSDAFTLLLYHSPDLMPEAVDLGVDLYLCGHTHGGQIRLPLFGALITSSQFWKRYEMGRYEEGGTTLYVSRGLGMEGLGTPRARFLAPPEIVQWTLSS